MARSVHVNGSVVAVLCAAALLLGCGSASHTRSSVPGRAQGLTRQATPPPGWKAISALGIGLFVPAGWRVDTRCTDEVITPLGVDRMPPGASCPAPAHRQLSIEAIGLASDGRCVNPRVEFRIGTERPCLYQYGAGHFGFTLGRGRDLVSVTMNRTTQIEAVRILRTAQAVDVDNRDCASRYTPSTTPRRLWGNDHRITACVYRATETRYPPRLRWSTTLTGADVSAVLDRSTASRPPPERCLIAGAPPQLVELHSSNGPVVTATVDECTRLTTLGSGRQVRYLDASGTERLQRLVTGEYR